MKVPATVEAAFNCVALKAVPAVMADGVAQVMDGVTLFTVRLTTPVVLL